MLIGIKMFEMLKKSTSILHTGQEYISGSNRKTDRQPDGQTDNQRVVSVLKEPNCIFYYLPEFIFTLI